MTVRAVALKSYADKVVALIPALRPVVVAESAGLVSPGSNITRLTADFACAHRPRKRGDYLFRAGDAFQFIYALNAGFAKTCYTSLEGREQTTGLYLPGDILGLDAVASGVYHCDAIAVDTCDVVAIPYDALLACSQRSPDLVRELYGAFSSEIRINRDLMLNIRSLHAAGRVAAFLLDTSQRFAARGFSATQLQLRLTRHEIGSLLGLELETVSRAISRFAQLGLITVYLREIVLLDLAGLQAIIVQPNPPRQGKKVCRAEKYFGKAKNFFPAFVAN